MRSRLQVDQSFLIRDRHCVDVTRMRRSLRNRPVEFRKHVTEVSDKIKFD